MAPMSLLFLGFFLSFLHSSDAQTIIGSSSSFFSPLDLPINSSPPPTKQTARIWPSLPPRGRSDVPIRATVRDRLTNTNTVQQGKRMTRPTAQSTPTFISVLSRHNLSSGPIFTQPTASRPRTDTASLAFSRAFANGDYTTKGSTPPLPTLPSIAVAEPAGYKPVTAGNPEEESVRESENVDSQGLGSGSTPTGMLLKDQSPVPLPTVGDERAQYRPQAQTAISEIFDIKTPPPHSQTVKPDLFVLTRASKIPKTSQTEARSTLSPLVTQVTPRTVESTGELTANTPVADRVSTKQDSAAVTTTTTGSTDKQPGASGLPVTAQSQKSSNSNTTTPQVTTISTTSVLTTTQEAVRTSSKASNQPNKTAQLGKNMVSTTLQSSRAGTTSFLTTGVVPVTRSRFGPTYQTGIGKRNRSILLGHPHQAPQSTSYPVPSPSANPSPNGTLLYWGDLSRTLAFAWELHVYGSASLFLLLFAGAALGLTLSPGTNCPHRGAVALANALLFLAGGLRATLFLIDPYGTRKLLPRPAVTALYNLPLHLLVWTHAALALLALRVAGISVLPSTMERPPLVAVLAVLQCTLLLAADLLSPALSPVVPVTLQVLSLCWGLALCLGFLCYIFPRIRGVPEETRRKAWTGSRRIGVILGRVLAVCAVVGALCCGLHVHATLWLYGLLGDWTHFSWGWWLVHFWARLLELAWGFCLLLLGSWVFWRPQGWQGREEGGPDGRAPGDLPSPGQSVGSTQRHTCWSKIVQSLRGKPCRKSDSNGVGGGGPGEVPNNWAGQERPGADISKSLIRNQNHEQALAQPRYVKDSNRGRNHRGRSAERGISDGSTGSLLRLQALGRPPQRSVSGSLDQDRDTSLSLYEFDLRPPSPIDLTRSIDEALHREHLLGGGSLFHPLNQISQSPSPGSVVSQGPWLRRNSDPQLLSESSEAPTESSMPLGGSILSSVPSRQVTAPPTPSHQGHRWAGNGAGSVPSSVSCPVSLRPSRTSTGLLGEDGVDDTRPFITPDSERVRGRAGRPVGSRSYLEVSRHDDSASVSSEIIDL
ncbi:proline-rich transmembrane protein 3 isoform X2 [Xiphias gladius]|nr:proline-rich transmembrane protein 3 isoform X2 [Xiphias gladius]XP_040008378.1 proline-rich transmembrane protein 3 isoform X2 [Xiphias gladius]XP_040008379.1 proline-rich transmembrane protein 3 isoform X2 [Xiphias gladius]XP_040008380.1 proline-rich transmembrane protein 3 isoform X2 [Xiphias gladius]XP_040008381.1 proline-rich transmembrane protein 3 isoform X2 [Xiphias gladius]XP_040008382.1 proline-rich transmembrane protein 3 isoform X2 [Xiphias gladius]